MSENKVHTKNLDKLTEDILKPININYRFKAWMVFLVLSLMVCIYAYTIQLRQGLSVTGLRDFISWGMYITNFVFFVAASLIGMLISSVIGLLGFKWITPIARMAEIIAVAFAAVAGLVIISDMGRPERLIYVFVYGRFQSPILWDVTVVTTYFVLSGLLYFIPMIPDLAISGKHLRNAPDWLLKVYKILSLGFTGNTEQIALIKKLVRMLLILIIPVALAIHTVTSWLFASTPRVGWDSTIFGPYFISGAFVAGVSALIVAMYFYRKSYCLQEYITDLHFDKMGKLLVLVSLVYLYFNINEFLVPGYKLKEDDTVHLKALFTGRYAPMFWGVQLLGLIIPIILLLFKQIRKPLPMLIISLFVLIGAWFKRYLIVVPTQEHPSLPIQNVPEMFKFYQPTLIETAITVASFLLVLLIITTLSKLFPILPIWEMSEGHNTENENG